MQATETRFLFELGPVGGGDLGRVAGRSGLNGPMLLLFIVAVEMVLQRGRKEEVVLLAMNGCGRLCQVSSRSTCATSKRLMDFLPANDLIITAGREFYDIILRADAFLSRHKRDFQMGQDCTASSPLAAPLGA